jgi:putative transposase
MAYIDTKMVRAGVVSHPSLWSFSGYNEIQQPRRKNILIDYKKLQLLVGSGSYDKLKSSHRGWVDEYLANKSEGRQDEWTDSIAVGSKPFIEKVKSLLGFKAKRRDAIEGEEGYHLRKEPAP